MLIGLVGDIHFSQYSSILRKQGEKYSVRLENCINSINWAESLFNYYNCDSIVYLGDFFDTESLNSVEITALNDVVWSTNIYHEFLCGNHEMGKADLFYNSANILNLIKNSDVITTPTKTMIDDCEICYLPYILEDDRKSLVDYFGTTNNKRVILSHNDIAGMQMGQFKSKQGFDINEIASNCTYFINGHIHNEGKVADNIYNIGNLTGQNFSEDGFKYNHSVFILDTDTMKIQVFDNPYAVYFYKDDWTGGIPFDNPYKNFAVISVKVSEDTIDDAKQFIKDNPNIIESRVLLEPKLCTDMDKKEELSVDHLQKFREFIFSKLDNTELLQEEMEKICL